MTPSVKLLFLDSKEPLRYFSFRGRSRAGLVRATQNRTRLTWDIRGAKVHISWFWSVFSTPF